MKCPDCRSQLTGGATFCDCGWRAVGHEEKKKVVFRPCHFSGSGHCRYDRDRANRSLPPEGARIRVNDYWICNYHYENGYDRVLREGEVLPRHEQKIQARLFGGRFDEEPYLEREAMQTEGV